MNSNKNIKTFALLIGLAVFVFGIIYVGVSVSKKKSNNTKNQVVDKKNDYKEKLEQVYKEITINNIPARKEPVSIEPNDIKDTLPDISKYPPQVEKTTESFIEIFSSTEKSGDNKDGWLLEVAKEFNKSSVKVDDKTVSVRIRGIASGQGSDYIVSDKYSPDAFTPSNELWGEMIKSSGKQISLIEPKLTGNVAGIIFSKKKYDEIIKKYGSINLKAVTQSVSANEVAMGYTNPFASSTGLNFLISTLFTFDNENILSDKAVSGFEQFQNNIPFVSYTTLQMRNSAKSGVLDGFIMEYQTFTNTPDLKDNYVFTPFGVRHDSPMYSIGNLTDTKKEILKKFIELCKSDKFQKLATNYGFNQYDDYKAEQQTLDGETIVKAQKLWKDKKDSNNEIAAVFVADISGSMSGVPINNLKKSLLSGSQYIGKDNSIGLVSFSTDVNINLPIGKFDLNQRSLFTGAVKDLSANGSTAMFDAIVVATKMLLEEKEKKPNSKLMLFVLSDGETNRGNTLKDINDIMKESKIPIYTIGYNANIKALQTLSDINEAASINADSDDVVYKLNSLFNAQM